MALIGKDGRIVTDEDLDRMADEAEAGYDLTGWRLVPWRGRPSLTAGNAPGTHSPRVATRVPADLRQELLIYATREGRTISQVLRGLIEEYVLQRRDDAADGADAPPTDPRDR